MLRWKDLADRFRKATLAAGGPSKPGSGAMIVEFTQDGRIYVELGAYDISDWSSHTSVGTFSTEDEALAATAGKIAVAEYTVRVLREEEEDTI